MAPYDELIHRVERRTADYIGCIDDDALERWPTLFMEDGLYRIVTRENYARGMMHDRVAALRRANIYEPHVYRHLVAGTRLIREEPAGGWRFSTNFQVIRTMHTGEMVVFAVGVYDDVLVEREGGLVFAEKTVICDSSRIDTLLVIPL